MFVLWITLAGSILLQTVAVKGITPEILNNGTSLDTKNDDIAHFTCASRGEPRPLVQWEKKGVIVKDKDEGIAILSKSNGTVEESHLFVAVSGNARRGEYICVVSNEKGIAKQSFTIKGTSEGLSNLDIASICISVGLAIFIVSAIAFFLWRGVQKKKQTERRHRQRTISEASCQENGALMGDEGPGEERRIVRNGTRKSNTCTTSV